MLSQLKWVRTGLILILATVLLLGGLAWAKKPVKPPPEPDPEPPITYSVTYLGILPGNDRSVARDINNDGVVVGYCSTAEDDLSVERRAFVSYIDDTGQRVMKDLNDLVDISEFPDNYVLTLAYGINDKGQIVGGAWVPGEKGTGSSFRFTPGYIDEEMNEYVPSLVEDFGAPNMIGDWATDINDYGDVTGNWQDGPGNYRGYLYSDRDLDGDGIGGDQIDIGDLGDGEVRPNAINNLGQVVGNFTEREGGLPHAFAYSPDDGMNEIVFEESNRGFYANDINDSGFAVGLAKRTYEVQVNKKKSYTEVEWYAFQYDTLTGEWLNIGKPDGASASQAIAINSSGDVVGSGFGWDNSFLYLSDLGEIWTLDSLTGVELSAHPEVFSINDFGQICGFSVGLPGGYYQAYLLTPDLP